MSYLSCQSITPASRLNAIVHGWYLHSAVMCLYTRGTVFSNRFIPGPHFLLVIVMIRAELPPSSQQHLNMIIRIASLRQENSIISYKKPRAWGKSLHNLVQTLTALDNTITYAQKVKCIETVSRYEFQKDFRRILGP